ncbi:MAG: NosD domain-containing protein, partial [Promethearchaeia archaeon]
TLTANIANKNDYGIYVFKSDSNNFTDNVASENDVYHGFYLANSTDNVLSGNIADKNGQGGFVFMDSDGNSLSDNHGTDNYYCDIYFDSIEPEGNETFYWLNLPQGQEINVSFKATEETDEINVHLKDSEGNSHETLESHNEGSISFSTPKTDNYSIVIENPDGSSDTGPVALNISVTDLTPKSFTFTSTADDPDSDGEFWLNWTPSEHADNYTLYQNGEVIEEGITDVEFKISGLSTGTYIFVLEAINEYGKINSTDIEIKVGLVPWEFELSTNPEDPDLDGDFILNWTESEHADNYTIYQKDKVIAAGITSLNYTITDLEPGTYEFFVVAINKYGTIESNRITIEIDDSDDDIHEKDPMDEDSTISGYNILPLLGLTSLVSVILLKRQKR